MKNVWIDDHLTKTLKYYVNVVWSQCMFRASYARHAIGTHECSNFYVRFVCPASPCAFSTSCARHAHNPGPNNGLSVVCSPCAHPRQYSNGLSVVCSSFAHQQALAMVCPSCACRAHTPGPGNGLLPIAAQALIPPVLLGSSVKWQPYSS